MATALTHHNASLNLTNDLLEEVVIFLDMRDIAHFRSTDKRISGVVLSEYVAREKLRQINPEVRKRLDSVSNLGIRFKWQVVLKQEVMLSKLENMRERSANAIQRLRNQQAVISRRAQTRLECSLVFAQVVVSTLPCAIGQTPGGIIGISAFTP